MNVLVTIAIATGLSIDPPTACRARNAISQPRLGASQQASEPSGEDREADLEDACGGPPGPPVDPDSISRLAITSRYASTVHCSPETGARKSRPIDGSATLMIVASIPTTNRLRQQMASTRYRRWRLSSGSAISSFNA